MNTGKGIRAGTLKLNYEQLHKSQGLNYKGKNALNEVGENRALFPCLVKVYSGNIQSLKLFLMFSNISTSPVTM